MHAGSSHVGWRAARIGGALAFASSLSYFAWRYATDFGDAAAGGESIARPLTVNALLFSAFALHHSLFARSGAKSMVKALVSPELERTVYVWIASALFAALTWLWRPVPGLLWEAGGVGAWLLHGAQFSAVVIAFAAGRQFSARELAGLAGAHGRRPAEAPSDRGPYGFVRHPLYVALLLALWPVPTMTGTRLAFAAFATVYVLIAMPLEERDLRTGWGGAYERYAARVRYRLVPYVY